MNPYAHIAHENHARLTEAPLTNRESMPAENAASGRGRNFEWTGLLARVGALAGAFAACFMAKQSNRGIALAGALVGGLAGAMVGALIDCIA